jgi:MraZ protein
VFRGVNAIQLDEKGRINFPARYRQRLETEAKGQLIVTIDTELHCLLLYPLTAWESIEQKIEALPSFNRQARRIQRLLIGHATEVELDGQGRILLPPLLRDYADLQKSVVLVGQGKKFEIWNENTWNESRKRWIEEGMESGGELPSDLESLSL